MVKSTQLKLIAITYSWASRRTRFRFIILNFKGLEARSRNLIFNWNINSNLGAAICWRSLSSTTITRCWGCLEMKRRTLFLINKPPRPDSHHRTQHCLLFLLSSLKDQTHLTSRSGTWLLDPLLKTVFQFISRKNQRIQPKRKNQRPTDREMQWNRRSNLKSPKRRPHSTDSWPLLVDFARLLNTTKRLTNTTSRSTTSQMAAPSMRQGTYWETQTGPSTGNRRSSA